MLPRCSCFSFGCSDEELSLKYETALIRSAIRVAPIYRVFQKSLCKGSGLSLSPDHPIRKISSGMSQKSSSFDPRNTVSLAISAVIFRLRHALCATFVWPSEVQDA